MTDREDFEIWIRPWLWTIGNPTLDRLSASGPYASPYVQLAWQAFVHSRRGGFVETGPVDIDLSS